MEEEWIIEEDEELAKEVEKLEKESKSEDTLSIEKIAKLFEKGDVARLEAEHFTEPQQIVCKYCGSKDIMKYGIRNGVQNYICRKCGRKFTTKDAPLGTRTSVEQIGASLNMYDVPPKNCTSYNVRLVNK